ncbi:MAG TPA: 16S rRNA (guanine(966)-N(2))-methyltransferase RsmD [bacterium]|nr:16S rRNA (guanine(966)-N(2))-methyltransferase RsmD [bacterium]HPN42562.1 16S rRNA (guanine(966)-N(2))-methyltransferase RsmD [bacterium]
MRVIAGKFKGFGLFSPKGKDIRPSADRTREFLFSWLGDRVVNCSFLDLFAGTGSVGIEALSRNARQVIFVDNSQTACDLVKRNLQKINASAEVLLKNEKVYLRQAAVRNLLFDIIFADPPYHYQDFFELLDLIIQGNLLSNTGLVLFETAKRDMNTNHPGFSIIKEKIMGDNKILVYERNE